MGFWQRLFGLEAKMTSLELFREVLGSRETGTGISINADKALGVATVLACCRVLAEGVAQVPFRLYQDKDGRRHLAKEHPVYNVLYRAPNAWQTSFEFRETLMFHTVLTGNAFIFVNRVGAGRAVHELIIIEPQRVTVEQKEDYRLVYRINGLDGQTKEFPQETIWHVRGPSWNGWYGLDATKKAAEAMGLAIALEQNHAAFHKNSARTTGLFSVDGTLSPEKYKELSAWLDKYALGGERYNKPMVLDLGAKYTPMQMTGVDAQHLETRKHQIEEICRAFRVMPIMVGYSDKTATYASAEQMFLAHVIHTLSPWYERLEQSADVNLLTPEERATGYYTKFTPNALMRGAARDRAEFYARALGSGGSKGWMTQNEARSLEELDRIDDPAADLLPQPPNKMENTTRVAG